jgi:photosystem II stability/assembly factor-like uncharacterized protein
MAKLILIVLLACLIIVSGARGQEYDWHITYPPPDSGKYAYSFTAVDCWGEVCTAVGNKRTPSIKTIDRNVPMTFTSTDGGQKWTEHDPGLPHERGDQIGQLWEIQQIDSLTAVAAGDSGIIVKTTDGGNTWVRQALQTYGRVWAINFSDRKTGIAVKSWTGHADSVNILTTRDGGTTWKPSRFVPWLYANECHSDGGSSFRVIGYGGDDLYYTHDDWNTIDSTPYIVPVPDNVHIISQCNFAGSDTLVASGAASPGSTPFLYLIRSTDGGANWTQIDVPDSIVYPPCSMTSLDSGIVFLGGTSDHQQIVVSMDHGHSWNIESYAFDADTVPHTIISIAVMAGDRAVGVFGTLPSFSSVLAYGEPMNLGVETSQKIDSNIQVYPNPAAESVVVTSANRQLSIVDPLGRNYETRVLTGEEGQLTRLDISSLPSGIYFVSDGRSRAKFVKE